MIKAEDLRIGDLVRVSCNCSLAEGTIGTIVEISKETNAEDTKGFVRLIPINSVSNWGWGIYCDNVEGIQLTLEILEKNGWKRDKLVPYIYGHEAHNIEVICTPNSEWVYVTFKGDTIHRIKYVHELQHILWALGLDANLKI